MKRYLCSLVIGLGACQSAPTPERLNIDLQPTTAAPSKSAGEPFVVSKPEDFDWQKLFQAAPTEEQRTELSKKIALWEKTSNADELYKRAKSELALGLSKRAEASLRQVLRENDEHIDATIDLAQLQTRQNHLDEAFEYLNYAHQLIKKIAEPDRVTRVKYKYSLALATIAKGDRRLGHQLLSELIEAERNFTPAYVALAASYLRTNQLEAAEFIVKRGMDRGKEDARLTNIMGVIQAKLGNDEEAKRWYEKTLVIAPLYAPAYINRAHLATAQAQYDVAEQDLLKALSIAPDHVEAYIALGVVAKKLGKFPDAEAAFQRAIALAPENGYARYNMAMLFAGKADSRNESMRLFLEASQAKDSSEELRNLAQLQIESLKDSMAIN